MLPLIRRFVVLSLLISPTAHAADLPGPWVELASDGGLDVRSITAPGMACPKVVGDGAALASKPRGKADGDYPVQVCVAHAAAATRAITVDGLPVPALPNEIKQIVVIGDTGCRLKGTFTQDCNDPVKWPFAVVARLAAARHPDLVIHVGDYHYRETACPDDAARLRRKSVWRQLGGMAEGLLRSCRAAAGGRTLGAGARQSRTMQPRRPWLVSSARSASGG